MDSLTICTNGFINGFMLKNGFIKNMHAKIMDAYLQGCFLKNPLLWFSVNLKLPARISVIEVANRDIKERGSTPESMSSRAFLTIATVSACKAESNKLSIFSSDAEPT